MVMIDQTSLFGFYDERKCKEFKVQYIRKPIKTKEYKAKNGRIYKDTIYEILGIKITNPKIYVDEKTKDWHVIWYPKHKELLDLIKIMVSLKDGYTSKFFEEVLKCIVVHFFIKGYSKEKVREIIENIFSNIYEIKRGDKGERKEDNSKVVQSEKAERSSGDKGTKRCGLLCSLFDLRFYNNGKVEKRSHSEE